MPDVDELFIHAGEIEDGGSGEVVAFSSSELPSLLLTGSTEYHYSSYSPQQHAAAGPFGGVTMDDPACKLFDFVVCTLVIGIICLFGLCGNLTSFGVLYKQNKVMPKK